MNNEAMGMTNEKAIEILENYHNGYFGYKIDEVLEAHKKAIESMKEERPKGRWIETVEHRGYFAGDRTVYSYTCPFCKVKEFKKYKFCHCGADMREETT